jgi:hypothetical protein
MTKRLYSIGHLSKACQASVPSLRAALDKMGVRPVMLQDDVDYYSATAVEKLQNHFFQKRMLTMGTYFERLVASRMDAAGEDRKTATAAIARANPAAHREFLQQTQATDSAARCVGRRTKAPEITGRGRGFLDLVQSEMSESGCTRKTAVARIARRSPKLHAAFLKSTNDSANHNTINEMIG